MGILSWHKTWGMQETESVTTSLEWWKSNIASMINQQLNPANNGSAAKGWTTARRMHLESLCPIPVYLGIFKDAKPFKRTKKSRKIPKYLRPPVYLKTRRLYSQRFTSMRDLDQVFGEDWYTVFNGFDVGFALPPFDVRLV